MGLANGGLPTIKLPGTKYLLAEANPMKPTLSPVCSRCSWERRRHVRNREPSNTNPWDFQPCAGRTVQQVWDKAPSPFTAYLGD